MGLAFLVGGGAVAFVPCGLFLTNFLRQFFLFWKFELNLNLQFLLVLFLRGWEATNFFLNLKFSLDFVFSIKIREN
jgi:hypothetical protein